MASEPHDEPQAQPDSNATPPTEATPAEGGADSAAARAAMALVQAHGTSVSSVGTTNRARWIAMLVITFGVGGFFVCVATGMALSQWAFEIYTGDLPDAIAFVFQNHGPILALHIAAGVLAIVCTAGYMVAHYRFRRRYRDLREDLRPRPVVPTWYAVLVSAVVATGLIGTGVVSQSIPDKPSQQELLNNRLAEGSELYDGGMIGGGPNSGSPYGPGTFDQQDGSLMAALTHTPDYIDEDREKEAWLLHTFWLPMGTGLMMLMLLPAAYSVQRAKPEHPKVAASKKAKGTSGA